MMNKLLMICCLLLFVVLGSAPGKADDLQLTLDLRNSFIRDPLGGGTWQLFARVIQTDVGASGDFGLSGIRALINNIDIGSITFASNIGQLSGGPYTQTLSNGTVEIVYGQNLSGSVVTGVGVPPTEAPFRDTLIASGKWPAGPRPTFGSDGTSAGTSVGSFLSVAGPPYSGSVLADTTLTSTVTLGDMNNSGTVTSLDISLFVAQLGTAPLLPYNPAGDINQSGRVTNADIPVFLAILTGPLSATGTVPEPSTLLLAGLIVVCTSLRRRKV